MTLRAKDEGLRLYIPLRTHFWQMVQDALITTEPYICLASKKPWWTVRLL